MLVLVLDNLNTHSLASLYEAFPAPEAKRLASELSAWADRRNAKGAAIDWRFSLDDARIKLKRLYPSTQP